MSIKDVLTVIDETEAFAKQQLLTHPHCGICLHTIEQTDYLRKAIEGDKAALSHIRKNFDLGIMAVKTEGEIDNEKFYDNLYALSAYVNSL